MHNPTNTMQIIQPRQKEIEVQLDHSQRDPPIDKPLSKKPQRLPQGFVCQTYMSAPLWTSDLEAFRGRAKYRMASVRRVCFCDVLFDLAFVLGCANCIGVVDFEGYNAFVLGVVSIT